MKMFYNRFAILPVKCNYCGQYIWLEKYRYEVDHKFNILFGEYDVSTITCRDCIADQEFDEEEI